MTIIDKYNEKLHRNISIIEFMSLFSKQADCLELYFVIQYSDTNCEKCGRDVISNYARVKRISKGVQKKSFRCKSCHTHIYPMSNTIFKRTQVNLTGIFLVIFFLSAAKKSHSATNLLSYTGASYKTTHRLAMKIRDVMFDDLGRKFKGIIEVDEVFIGKGSRYFNWSSISTRKQPIVGMIERDTKKAKVFLVDNRNVSTLNMLIKNNVEVGSTVFTDSWAGYSSLKKWYNHDFVNHSDHEYVRGNIHTNTIESLWGGFKRNIRGAHIHITSKYVQQYMNELCWKFNNKDITAMQRFDKLLRSTYKDICSTSPHTIVNKKKHLWITL